MAAISTKKVKAKHERKPRCILRQSTAQPVFRQPDTKTGGRHGSPYLDLVIGDKMEGWDRFKDYQKISLTTHINQQAVYEDNLVYRF